MKLILTRHGETEGNKQGIIQGHLHGVLTNNGIEQGEKLAKRLVKEKIDIIYSSDLARALDTAKIVQKEHLNVPLKISKELREFYPGKIEGKSNDLYDPKNLPKDHESFQNLRNRAENFLLSILKKHKDDTVLFICHGGIGHAIVCSITDKPAECIDKNNLKNASISIFEIDQDKNHKIHIYNSDKHLI